MRIHAALLVGLYIYRSLSTVHHAHADAMLMLYWLDTVRCPPSTMTMLMLCSC